MFVYNHDVVGLHARVNRFIAEMVKAGSANLSQVNSFDQTRLASYLNAITVYMDWVEAQPQLDLPETAPRQYDLDANPEVPRLENESIQDVVRLMEIARDEMVSSQSARMPAGMVAFDSARIRAIVAKVEAFLANYIATTTPLDLPESSPMREVTGPGNTGV